MKKLLVVTYYFPPINEIASRRFMGIVDVLSKHGWDVTVLTTNSSGSLEFDCSNIRIFREGQGAHSRGLGGNSTDRNDNEASVDKFPQWLRVLRMLRDSLGLESRYIDRLFFTWYIPSRLKFIGLLRKLGQYDIVWASYGPGASLLLGSAIARQQRIPLIADIRDLGALREDDVPRNPATRWFDAHLERRLLTRAAAITTVSQTLSSILTRNYGTKAHTVYNGWDDSMSGRRQAASLFKVEPVRRPLIYYAGRIYGHRLESFRVLLQGVRGTSWTIRVRCLNLDAATEVGTLVEDLGLRDTVEFLPTVSAAQADAEAAVADINLVLEDLSTAHEGSKGTLTGKLLPMLPLTPPILAVARPDSEIGIILTETGKGRLCSTPAEVAAMLRASQSDNIQKTSSGAISRFSKTKQANVLAALLDHCVA